MVQWWCHSFKRMLKQFVKFQTSIALSYQQKSIRVSQFDHHHHRHHCYYLLLQKCSSFATESSKFLFIYVLCVIYLELVESFEAMTARLASISPAPIDLQCVRSRAFCVHSLPPGFLWIDQIYRSIAEIKHTTTHTQYIKPWQVFVLSQMFKAHKIDDMWIYCLDRRQP